MLSEPGDQSSPLSLDVVRARIFYLACDVEQASPPAAMMLRAVADAIADPSGGKSASDVAGGSTAIADLMSHVSSIRTLPRRPDQAAPTRRLDVVSSQSGFKR